jgi:hypothetical protein
MTFVRLVAIAKDEGAYLPEWIHHHLYFGFDEIVVIHNDCSDNTVEILEQISKKEPRLIIRNGNEFKRKIELVGGHFQQRSYSEELALARKDGYITHIMYLDIDEFWLTKDLNKSIHQFIKNHLEADSISFAWHFEYPSNPDIFSSTLNEKFKVQKNMHVKSIHRITDRFKRPDIHNGTHDDGKYLTANGIEFPSNIFNGCERAGLPDQLFKVNLDNLDSSFIYHRIYRSQQEYLATLLRGRPHEKNNVSLKSNRWGYRSLSNVPVIDVTYDEKVIKSLKEDFSLFLKTHGLEHHLEASQNHLMLRYRKVLEIITNLDYTLSNNLKMFDKVEIDDAAIILEARKKLIFHIDSTVTTIKSIKVKGWSLISDSEIPVNLLASCKLNEQFTVKNYDRPDVYEKFPNSTKSSGFEIEVLDNDFFKLDFNFEIKNKKIKLSKSFSSLMFPINLAYFFSEQALIANYILEYGAGSSTKFLIKNSKRCMSVESDSNFLLNLLQEISTSGFDITSTPVYINIGKTKEWGHPVDDSCKAAWHDYPLKPWKILASNNISPDLVLIDGRFRVACMLATMASIKKPTKVIFDDYVDRPYKKIVEKYCKPLKIIDRAAYFELTPGMLSAADLLDCFDQFFEPA